MDEHLFHDRTVHHSIILCHNGLADIVRPNASLANACIQRTGLPIYVFGSTLFLDEMQKHISFENTVTKRGMFIVEFADTIDEGVIDVVKCFALKLVITACCPTRSTLHDTLLPLLNHVDRLPPNDHLHGRIFQLDECAQYLLPREFDPDHHVSRGDSYFCPSLYKKHAVQETLMSYPNAGGFDATLVRVNGAYKYRPDTPRCFDPLVLASYSGKITAVLRNLDGVALILTKDVRPIVIALEAAGYRRKDSPALFEVMPPNGKFYAVACAKDWETAARTTEDVVIASAGGAHLINPTQIHVLEPSSIKNLFKSCLFNISIKCKLFLHAAEAEVYAPFPPPCFDPPCWKTAIHGDLALHYALHRDSLVNVGAVTGAIDVEVVEELHRLVADRSTVKDRMGTSGYIALDNASTYLFQPDQMGNRFDFESIIERGAEEDIAAAYVFERLEFDDCVSLMHKAPSSRAERAFRRYMLANCWSPPSTYTFWRRDGSLQGITEDGDIVPGVSKPWTRGGARVRQGTFKLLTPQKFTISQLQAMAESTLLDKTELWLKIELKIRARGLVLTPLQI